MQMHNGRANPLKNVIMIIIDHQLEPGQQADRQAARQKGGSLQ